MGLSSPGQAEITSLDSANIDEVLSKPSHWRPQKCLCGNNLTLRKKHLLSSLLTAAWEDQYHSCVFSFWFMVKVSSWGWKQAGGVGGKEGYKPISVKCQFSFLLSWRWEIFVFPSLWQISKPPGRFQFRTEPRRGRSLLSQTEAGI